jgi:hypothetical protein
MQYFYVQEQPIPQIHKSLLATLIVYFIVDIILFLVASLYSAWAIIAIPFVKLGANIRVQRIRMVFPSIYGIQCVQLADLFLTDFLSSPVNIFVIPKPEINPRRIVYHYTSCSQSACGNISNKLCGQKVANTQQFLKHSCDPN